MAVSEEREQQELFEDASMGIFRTTPEGKLINVNPAFTRMFGFDSPEEAKSRVDDVAVDICMLILHAVMKSCVCIWMEMRLSVRGNPDRRKDGAPSRLSFMPGRCMTQTGNFYILTAL